MKSRRWFLVKSSFKFCTFLLTLFPNNQILDVTKLKAIAENKINVAPMMISVFGRVENIVGKGEYAGYQHFLLFPQCFQKASFLGSFKVRIVWKRVKVLWLVEWKIEKNSYTYMCLKKILNHVKKTPKLPLQSVTNQIYS